VSPEAAQNFATHETTDRLDTPVEEGALQVRPLNTEASPLESTATQKEKFAQETALVVPVVPSTVLADTQAALEYFAATPSAVITVQSPTAAHEASTRCVEVPAPTEWTVATPLSMTTALPLMSVATHSVLLGHEMLVRAVVPSTEVGLDQVEPLKWTVAPLLSAAVQSEELAQETPTSPVESTDVGPDHVPALMAKARPLSSTITQLLDEVHDRDAGTEFVSSATGLDQLDPSKVRTSPIVSVAAQKDVVGHDKVSRPCVSMLTGSDHVPDDIVRTEPFASTATQLDVLGHEIALIAVESTLVIEFVVPKAATAP
jgi:hypothetical protein